MAEARKYTKRELEAIFLDQWRPFCDDDRHAQKLLYALQGWLGPRLWGVICDLPFKPNELDNLFNVLARSRAAGTSADECIAWLLRKTAEGYADVPNEIYHPVLETPKVAGNVVHLPFGRRNETTDSSDM